MKSLATVATLLLAVFAVQPALAQEDTEAETVAGLPILPTTSTSDLLAMRDKWGTEPSMSTAQPGQATKSEKSEKSNENK